MFTCSHKNDLFFVFDVFYFQFALLKSQVFRNVVQRTHFQFMHFNKCYGF